MRIVIISFTLAVIMGITIITSCRKADGIMLGQVGNYFTKSTMSNFSQYVSYDASHNVLVFSRFEDVELFFDALENYDNNFPWDRGNTDLFIDQFRLIREYGFTVGTGEGLLPTNKVNLPQLEALLLANYPLSDTVLNELIVLYNELQPVSFPPPFMRTVLEANASFSYDVRENIVQSSLPPGIKNQILEKDDNTTMVPNHAYDDFLNSFSGYQSLYKTLELVEKTQLESGMDPANPLFDNDFVSDEQLRLILNTQREVYIKNSLIKLYDSCRYAIFQGSITEAYAQLALVDNNGFKPIPSGIAETPAGLTITEMSNYFPMNYALAHPDYIELKEERGGKDINMAAFQAPIEFCPQSNILFTKPIADGLTVNYTAHVSNSANIGTVYRYWTFGDGTGSFQANPTHTYMQPGAYQVTLTTFNDQCGCWDVEKIDIGVGFFEKGCDLSITHTYLQNNGDEVTFIIVPFNDNPFATLVSVMWDFGDAGGNVQFNTLTTMQHTYLNHGVYDVKVTIEYSDGCVTSVSDQVLIGKSGCCDRGVRERNRKVDIFNDGNHRLKVKARSNGNAGIYGLNIGSKLKGSMKFYIRRNNSIFFKTVKASEMGIQFSGLIYGLSNGSCVENGTNVIDDGETKYDKKQMSHSVDVGGGFGLKDNTVTVLYFVKFDTLTNTTTLKLGDCN
jgi:PKD repeat protein